MGVLDVVHGSSTRASYQGCSQGVAANIAWCMAHRLELAIKDALKGTTFDEIDEMLLRLYYLYEKSPNKCRELEDIVADLKGAMCFDDARVKPVRASGSRWVVHKLNAMKRVISKYGAYTHHLAAPSEDPSVRSADKAKLNGYCMKWIKAKYILGRAVYPPPLNTPLPP